MSDRPNIVLIHSDQHRADCLGSAGHPLLRTPHLDRIAREGVRFTHAFTPIPICSPARASLVTGAWPTAHRCVNIPNTDTYRPARDDLPLLTELIKDAGYRTAHVGKFHGETVGHPDEHGVDDFVNAWHYRKWRDEQGLPPRPRTNDGFGELDPHVTPDQTEEAWMMDHALRLIEAYADGDRPFFLRWDPPQPHLPNVIPEPYASMYRPDQIEPWPSFPDPLRDKPYAQRQQRVLWGTDDWTWEQWAPVVARYLGNITLIDDQVGRLLALLERLGIADDTLVIYSTDHGDMCGGHGMMDKHFNMYDDITRVPLLLRWPAQLGRAGRVSDAFVCNEIDLARTICSATGATVPETFVGHDLLPIARGEQQGERQDIFAMYQGAELSLYTSRMVRDRAWKYIYNGPAQDELYHLASDPGELHNRIHDPSAQRELDRLRARLLIWMEQIGDTLNRMWLKRLWHNESGRDLPAA